MFAARTPTTGIWTRSRGALLSVGLAMMMAFGPAATAWVHAAGSSPREITWETLVPKLPPLVDPLEAMDAERRIELETILWVRQLSDAERKQRPEVVEEAARYEKAFAGRGISIDKLIRDYMVWSEENDKRRAAVEPSLAGAMITMSGYLLPLEFAEDGDTDFLLVPYVGACIHVPAPPANQIVLVRLAKKFKAQDVFTAVKVTGRMATTASSKELSLVDGSAPVEVGYQLDAASVTVLPQ